VTTSVISLIIFKNENIMIKCLTNVKNILMKFLKVFDITTNYLLPIKNGYNINYP